MPILLAWSPYGKHSLSNQVFWPRSGVELEWLSDLTSFEGPDPVWWGDKGFGVAVVDPRGGRVLAFGVIDNLGKGAAGQAVQNMNLMFGLPESTGLGQVAVVP